MGFPKVTVGLSGKSHLIILLDTSSSQNVILFLVFVIPHSPSSLLLAFLYSSLKYEYYILGFLVFSLCLGYFTISFRNCVIPPISSPPCYIYISYIGSIRYFVYFFQLLPKEVCYTPKLRTPAQLTLPWMMLSVSMVVKTICWCFPIYISSPDFS